MQKIVANHYPVEVNEKHEKKEKMAKKFKMGSDRTPAGDGFLAVKKEHQKK